ncbi:MAG: isochorismatase family protein [Aquamicrobium sp.]|uniref:isochorismatase family protein n=1 Tax=Aquamicrobium sp. TaxID=1872579 RepID=UPI00349E6FBD|nr:isochorismatase family protein [Aquamicrobium sp.]
MAKTLLELAGADLTPPKLGQTVVVVVDAQREYVDGRLPLHGVDAALANIAALLAAARAAGAPVIHVRHKGQPGGLFGPDTTGYALAPQAAALAGETVIDKGLPNSFAGTALKEALDATGRKRLVVAGFMTHMCVSSTTRAASEHGFAVVVLSDATATRDLPAPGGSGVIPAAALHEAELAALADRFALVCPTAELVR